MKVYCGDCRYYHSVPVGDYGSGGYGYCQLLREKHEDATAKYFLPVVSGHKDKNKNNNCKDWDRKWWKFWVERRA